MPFTSSARRLKKFAVVPVELSTNKRRFKQGSAEIVTYVDGDSETFSSCVFESEVASSRLLSCQDYFDPQ